jgi:predicted secreted protein
MNWTLGLATYYLVWWVMLFAVLPWGVRSQREAGEVVPGSDPGAPAKTRFLFWIGVNSALSAVIWVLIDLAYLYFYVP